MTDPSLAIHDALILAIRNLSTEAGKRVFGQIQLNKVKYPYVTVWPGTSVPVDEECSDRTETTMQIDVWADTETYFRAKEISGEIRSAMHEHEDALAVVGHVVDRIRVGSITNFAPSPNYRAMISLVIETQPAA